MVKHAMFRVERITTTPHWGHRDEIVETVELECSRDPLNEAFAEGLPCGGLKLVLSRPAALGSFRVGQRVLCRFEDAPQDEPGDRFEG